MKMIFYFFGALSANPADILKQPRRYRDLDSMIQKINPRFDPRQYWAYGCHCFSMDDRPMSGTGRGRPVDKFDHLCKIYKDCQKCARTLFGEVLNQYLVKHHLVIILT